MRGPNHPIRRLSTESGQALLLVMLAASLFLLGGLGLAIDGATLYGHQQMAQAAADAAAQAAAMSVLGGTNVGANAFGTGAFTCTAGSDSRSPCLYAARNGFNNATTDTIAVSFPASVTGVTLANDISPAAVRVRITRNVRTTLLRFLGGTSTNVAAAGTAAIVSVFSPVPMLILHPTKSGALSMSGNPSIRICGGPQRSIQVNSTSTSGISWNGNPNIDLSRGGKADTAGNCTTGTGSDLASWGGPPSSGLLSVQSPVGTSEHYVQPAVPMRDPYGNVAPPAQPADAGHKTSLGNGQHGCPASPKKGCQLYYPGYWTSDIDVKNETAVFQPGIYYLAPGRNFSNGANGDMLMCSDCPASADTGNAGMMVYFKAPASGSPGNIDLSANSDASLVGSGTGSAYKGLLFFMDRAAKGATHNLGGGGSMTLLGSIYLHNTPTTATNYQSLSLGGNSGSTTLIRGQIVVDALDMHGTPDITMQLSPTPSVFIDQVALVQ